MFRELTFPYSKNVPLLSFQFPYNGSVSGAIPTQFLTPSGSIRLGSNIPATVVAMPKAAVYEDRNSGARPNKIGIAVDRLISAPSAQPCATKQRSQPLLCRFVSLAADSRHQFRARQTTERSALLCRIARPSAAQWTSSSNSRRPIRPRATMNCSFRLRNT
jgi:hypothetical protein